MATKILPIFVKGEVVKGFGRGSKELGIPTANYSQDVVDKYSNELETGVYYGWACVDNDTVYKMVMSVGWNPFYKNQYKSMETHIMHKYSSDFYGSVLRVCIVGYIRPEMNFSSLEDLIKTINSDIDRADIELDKIECVDLKKHVFMTSKIVADSNTNGLR